MSVGPPAWSSQLLAERLPRRYWLRPMGLAAEYVARRIWTFLLLLAPDLALRSTGIAGPGQMRLSSTLVLAWKPMSPRWARKKWGSPSCSNRRPIYRNGTTSGVFQRSGND